MNQAIERYKLIKKKDCGCEEIYTLDVCIDENPDNPRENNDNIGIMVCFNKRYTIGDKHHLKTENFFSFNNIKEYLIKTEKAIVIFPLYLFDHSGLTIAIDNEKFKSCDSNGWDWSQIGYIYTTQERLKKYHCGDITNITDEEIKKILASEVDLYDQYLKGDYYGFILYKNGEQEESCWGFDDKNDMIEEAQRYVKGEWKQIK